MHRLADKAVHAAFSTGLAKRHVTPDAAQLAAVRRLQQLFDDLMALKYARRTKLRKIFVRPPIPRGIYMWGGVGRGKTLLMNCFFDTLPYVRKRRVHFHAFMQEVHQRLRDQRDAPDPLARVAEDIARETRLLCFDEFHVSDIADATILGRLVEALHGHGVVLYMTTNYPPEGLYPNGLQRQNFLPTIDFLLRTLDVIELDAGVDYRLRTLEKKPVFLTPADAGAEAVLAAQFEALAGGAGHDRPLEILGREVPVRRRGIGVVWFDFAVLCGGPRSQNDYLELARHFPTVLLSGIPVMTPAQASEARRFTWLVDVFYDHRVKLIASAAATPEALYTEGRQAGEFVRTASRLVEMQSHEYLASPHIS